MNPQELFRAGRLDEAIEQLGVELRNDPADAQRRIFLFELLCFAGNYSRAEKQLDVLAQRGADAAMGTLLYRSAIHAEQTRQEMFVAGTYPTGPAPRAVSGTLNGQHFTTLSDADPRIGPRLEVFAAGQYTWIPLEHIASVRMSPPKRLRDLLWAPALVRTGPDFQGIELGEVLFPVMAPLSWHHENDAVRLGRVTEWQELADGSQAPIGQRLLLVDDQEFPILELRELDIVPASVAVS
ncbi:MAG TPA: type VI secretion system accessory protein TagJ [Gemmatimonadales bacterium]